jgi:hypothetical protein
MGDRDIVTPEHAGEMQRLIENARLAVIPGFHGEYIGELTTPQDPELVKSTVYLINKFLSESL